MVVVVVTASVIMLEQSVQTQFTNGSAAGWPILSVTCVPSGGQFRELRSHGPHQGNVCVTVSISPGGDTWISRKGGSDDEQRQDHHHRRRARARHRASRSSGHVGSSKLSAAPEMRHAIRIRQADLLQSNRQRRRSHGNDSKGGCISRRMEARS
jgi:hypothetical protein